MNQLRTTRTRPALRQALLELLETQSLEAITVREIAARAEVGYATFFRHYPDKDALLHDLAADEIRRLLTMTLPLFHSADIESSVSALCSYIWKHRSIWTVLLTGGAAAALKEEYLAQALEHMEQDSRPHPWLSSELAVRFAVGALVDILAWWLTQPKPATIDYMAKVISRLAVAPIMDNQPI